MGDFPDWTVPTNIQNPQIDVRVQGGNIDAEITNALLNMNIKQSEVTLEVSQLDRTINRVDLGDSLAADGQYLSPPTTQVAKVLLRPGTGVIYTACVWVKNPDTADHTLTISLKQRLDGPAIFSETITIAAGFEGQKCISVGRVWRWPQIVIEVTGDLDTLQLGVNQPTKYDTYYYYNGQWVVWGNYALAATVAIYTFYQLPVLVQGWVIATRPPSKQYYFNKSWFDVDPATEVTVLTVKGRGKLRYIAWVTGGTAFLHIVCRIYCDGNIVTGYYQDRPDAINYYIGPNTTTQPRLLRYDSSNKRAVQVWDEEVEFNRELRVAFYNYDSSNTGSVRVLAAHYVLE